MLRLTLKGLWAHKLRFVLTGLAVILGVAFMSGTMILTDTMGRTFDDVLATNNEGVDAIVRRESAIEGDMAEVRERVDEATLADVLEVDGVDAAAGSIQGFAQLVRDDGAVANNELGATIGTAWIDDSRLNPFQLAEGRAPEAANEAVVDRATVTDEGWTIGDTFTVLAKTGPVELTLVGEATFGEIEGIPGSTMIATDLGTAQELFGEPGYFDSIVVAKSTDVRADELAVRLQSALADDQIEVLTGEADTADKQADLREDLKFFNTFLLAFAYISLFVGMFIIYNTFSIVIAQRTRDLAMLRAIGAGRRQVLRSVLLEAVAVGLVACAAGLGLGDRDVVRAARAARQGRPRHPVGPDRDHGRDDHHVGRRRRRRHRRLGGRPGAAGQPGGPDRRPARRRHRPLAPVRQAGRRRPHGHRRRRRRHGGGDRRRRRRSAPDARPRRRHDRARRVRARSGPRPPRAAGARHAGPGGVRHRRAPRPGERPTQPQAHVGHRGRAR